MEDSGVEPCAQDAEVEGFRFNLASNEARDEFYEPITHPFPPDPETDALKGEHNPTSDVPTKVFQLGDTETSDVTVAEPKRSISQEILERAHRIARDITSVSVTSDNPSAERDVIRDASTKSIFNNLISSPSSASSRVGRGETENLDGLLPEVLEVPEDQASSLGEEVIEESTKRQVDQRPRYYSNRATTLPAKLQCQIFDPKTHQKMTRWEIFKRKFYLGAAHAIPTRASEDTADLDTPRASTAGPIDTESFCEVTNIEGLDLEGIPPMTQRSRKLFSWTRLKTGLHFKRKTGKGKNEEGPTGEPKGEPDTTNTMGEEEEDEEDESYSQAASHGEEDEEGVTAATTSGPAAMKAKVEKDKSHNWFEALSQRLFTARRHRGVEDAPTPARPATAHTQQYYEIESNW